MDLTIDIFLQKLLKQTEKLYDLKLNITIKTDLKGYRLIGQCKKISAKNYIIRLHKKLLEEFKERYLDDVLTHEFAHAVQMELYKKNKPHSKEWKSVVEALSGVQYNRRENINYNLKKNRRYKTYLYECSCGEHNLSAIRHNRVVKNIMLYKCKKCGSKLRFLNSEDNRDTK
jgi:SprT protein